MSTEQKRYYLLSFDADALEGRLEGVFASPEEANESILSGSPSSYWIMTEIRYEQWKQECKS